MRAGQALPLLRNHETALIITHSPRGPHYRGGSAPPEEPCGVTELKRASNARPYDRITKERYIFAKTLPFACRGLHCRPANGAACDWHSRSPPIRAKTFFYSKKRPASVSLAGLISWCTISGSVQKTVQCTVFSDRSPRGECKPHRGAARARPVGDGAPPTSLSAAHNAKKDPQVYRLQVFHHGAPSAGAFKKQCSALFLATEFPRANQHRTVVLVAACGRPPCSRPWCKPKKSPRS